MANKSITKEDLTKLEENLGRMIAKGFSENTEQHQKILGILDKHAVMLIEHTEILKDHTERLKSHTEILKNHTEILKNHTEILKNHTEILKDHTERLTRIEKKLEGVVYHKEFDELKAEVEKIKEILAEKKFNN